MTNSSSSSSSSFKSLNISPWIIQSLNNLKIYKPSKIQELSIPLILKGEDVIGISKTGSGKTLAFSIPILQKISENPYGVYCIILTPTRELAIQINEQLLVIGSFIKIKVSLIIGGVDYIKQCEELNKIPHIIVGTPGRLAQHINEGITSLHLKRLKVIVYDEADRLFSNKSLKPKIRIILNSIPKKNRQSLLFTATLTNQLIKLKENALKRGKIVNLINLIKIKNKFPINLKQKIIIIPYHLRYCVLYQLLLKNPNKSTIIFSSKKSKVVTINELLKNLNFNSISLHSGLAQPERIENLNNFKLRKNPILIATDIASRGLDIPHVSRIINFDVPSSIIDYIHRIGRTSRIDNPGESITFISTPFQVEKINFIENQLNIKMKELFFNENEALKKLGLITKAKRNILISPEIEKRINKSLN